MFFTSLESVAVNNHVRLFFGRILCISKKSSFKAVNISSASSKTKILIFDRSTASLSTKSNNLPGVATITCAPSTICLICGLIGPPPYATTTDI